MLTLYPLNLFSFDYIFSTLDVIHKLDPFLRMATKKAKPNGQFEIQLAGAKEYQKQSYEKGEFHLAAIESDRGGFTPRGFSVNGHEEIFKPRMKQISQWLPLLEPYGLSFQKGGAGADISGLKNQKGMLFGFKPDSQRYFDYHHTGIDNFDSVNKRELELGVAAMTSLVYLLDKYGLK